MSPNYRELHDNGKEGQPIPVIPNEPSLSASEYTAESYAAYTAALAEIPILGTFELTPRCNYQCKMCYVRLTPVEMQPLRREQSAEEWLSLGRTVFDAGMTFLLMTGRAPRLRPDFSCRPEYMCLMTQTFVESLRAATE